VVVPGGEVVLSHLTLVAGPRRSALKVLGGAVRLDDVALIGGAAGAFVDEGRLDGRGVVLDGGYGLLARRGRTTLSDLTASGRLAAVALLGGELDLQRATTTGPSAEAGVTVAGGVARLAEVVIRSPGPAGLAIASAEVTARDLTIAGGGEAGGLILAEGSHARLDAVLVTGRGPGLVLTQGSTASAFAARFRTDPVHWIDCGSGARLTLRDAPPEAHQPCAAVP